MGKIDTDILLRKSMSKKAYLELQRSKRSRVGTGMRLGTVSFDGNKNNRRARKKSKEYCKHILREGVE